MLYQISFLNDPSPRHVLFAYLCSLQPANDGESQITAPQSINMYELAKQLKQNPEEIANDWANEYVHSEATSQTAQWSEEFDSFMKMKGVNSATEMDNTRQMHVFHFSSCHKIA